MNVRSQINAPARPRFGRAPALARRLQRWLDESRAARRSHRARTPMARLGPRAARVQTAAPRRRGASQPAKERVGRWAGVLLAILAPLRVARLFPSKLRGATAVRSGWPS